MFSSTRSSQPFHLMAAVFLAASLFWAGAGRAVSQDAEKKQTLVIGYPNPAIMINGTTKYNGLIYVKVYPVSPHLKKNGSGPVATSELTPSMRDVLQLPIGEYEVHYAMRTGSELKTFILRDIILRPDRASSLIVEMNSDAKSTIIGGDMTAQQMADGVRQAARENAELKAELTELKKKLAR